jgi:hypothetical protein
MCTGVVCHGGRALLILCQQPSGIRASRAAIFALHHVLRALSGGGKFRGIPRLFHPPLPLGYPDSQIVFGLVSPRICSCSALLSVVAL